MKHFDPEIERNLLAGDQLIAEIEVKKTGVSDLSRQELIRDLKRLQAQYKRSYSKDFKVHLPLGLGSILFSLPFMYFDSPGLGVLLFFAGFVNLVIHFLVRSGSKKYCPRIRKLKEHFEKAA